MGKLFAPDYERDEEDRVLFPNDRELRHRWQPEEAFEHPAKNNLFMLAEIIAYVAEPGETILDPFGGVGSIIVVCPDNPLVLIELEPRFAQLAIETANMNESRAIVVQGDCREFLPIPTDHAIFSPPFASDISNSTWKPEGTVEDLKSYKGGTRSMGNYNQFYFSRLMRKVYALLAQSVDKTLTIILRDNMRQGERQSISLPAVSSLNEVGFEVTDWFKRYVPPSSRRAYAKNKGWATVDDEDIIILRNTHSYRG